MASSTSAEDFLRPPRDDDVYETDERVDSLYCPLTNYRLPPGGARQFQQQFADIYFLRLTQLKPVLAEIARQAWEGLTIGGGPAKAEERVLDVQQGDICWVIGTVYMDLPLKPDILEDMQKEYYTTIPPPQRTYHDPKNPEKAQTMLEDESGRIRLVGSIIKKATLVTGAIISVLGTENKNGDFEVFDMKVPDFAPQPERWTRLNESSDGVKRRGSGEQNPTKKRKKIAFVSGLNMTGSNADAVAISTLRDFLLGASEDDSGSSVDASQISRLIVAGNSIEQDAIHKILEDDKTSNKFPKKIKSKYRRKFRYDPSSFNESPITQIDHFLAEILPTMPVTLMPGETDPANYTFPQQGIHRAMLPRGKSYCSDSPDEPGWLDNVTNPWEGEIEGWRFWGCSGQNIDDIMRYIDFGENGDWNDIDARLRAMEALLRLRITAPTAPDTLFCYPFQDKDPFTLESSPHVFFIGNQSATRSRTVEQRILEEDDDMDLDDYKSIKIRLITLSKFSETGELLLLNTETLETEIVKFDVQEPIEEGLDEEGDDAIMEDA
ncbi:N-acetyltransferase 9 [Ascosphaera pollenicola]|nr:N-acetyltransferase 9 [Ascosphaera pollenicola]